jgi:MFS-type transporter involved in bile tolerance (Atg22 family)
MEKNVSDFLDFLPWLNGVAHLLYIIAGFLAAAFAGSRHILAGMAAGVSSAVIAIVVFGVGSGFEGFVVTLLSGLALGGFAGGIYKLVLCINR